MSAHFKILSIEKEMKKISLEGPFDRYEFHKIKEVYQPLIDSVYSAILKKYASESIPAGIDFDFIMASYSSDDHRILAFYSIFKYAFRLEIELQTIYQWRGQGIPEEILNHYTGTLAYRERNSHSLLN